MNIMKKYYTIGSASEAAGLTLMIVQFDESGNQVGGFDLTHAYKPEEVSYEQYIAIQNNASGQAQGHFGLIDDDGAADLKKDIAASDKRDMAQAMRNKQHIIKETIEIGDMLKRDKAATKEVLKQKGVHRAIADEVLGKGLDVALEESINA